MMWVCRPGKHSRYYKQVVKDNHIFLAWDGYRYNLKGYNTIEEFKSVVIAEKNPEAPTTISNWAGQLYSFCVEMKIGDYVLVPSERSRFYTLAIITSDYLYKEKSDYPHIRDIQIVSDGIRREEFSLSTQYSLGAFRTVFKVKQEEEVLGLAGKQQR